MLITMKNKTKQTIIEKVQNELRVRIGSWRHISEVTGVPYSTISKIGQKQTTNPTIGNIQPLLDYFEREAA